jgi:transposase
MSKQRHYRSTEWAGLLEQWSRSGESAERFAARIGVTPATLSRWKRHTQASKDKAAVVGPVREKVEPNRSLFTPVQVVRRPRAPDGVVEIVTRTGCVVRVHGPVDEDTLSVVLGALGSC